MMRKAEKEVLNPDYRETDYVWYAAYGSNINEARFMKYINRCSDTTPPVDNRAFIFPYDIYFAANSKVWEDKGVAFLDDTKEGMAWGRIYKVTREQFCEIQIMEGPKYTKLVKLDELEKLPIVTFTADSVYELKNTPSAQYLDVIKKGLKEVYPDKTDMMIETYLHTREGCMEK